MVRKAFVVTFALVTVAAAFTACDDNGGGNGAIEADGSNAPVELPGEVTNKGTEDVTSRNEVDLQADDFYFEPTFVKATPGSTVTVTITNEGAANHTFTVDDAGIDEEIAPAGSTEATVTVPDDGIVNFYCRFHRSQGMQGAVFTQSGQTGGAPSTDQPSGGGTPGY